MRVSGVLTWLLVGAVAVAFLGPFAGLFAQLQPGQLSELFASASFWKALRITLITGGGGAALSLGFGLLFARQFALHDWKGRRAQRLLLLLPYLIPNFILATAYVVAWNPATGLLNPVLKFPAGLYGAWGMTFLFAVAHTPVAFLLLEDKIRRIDPAWREAARLAGSGSGTLLLRIELPLLVPTLLSAFSLCFALNISAFAIPAWIGAPERAYPLTYKIYQAIQVGGQEGIPQAAAFSLVLFVLALPPLALGAWVQRGERRLALVSGKASRIGFSGQTRGRFAAFQGLFFGIQLLFWIAPLGCLFLSTLVKPGCLQQYGWSCLADPTLRSYHYVLFDLAEARIGFKSSFVYGGLSSALIMCAAIGSLAVLARAPLQRRLTEGLFSLAVATPGAIIALGLIVTCSGRYGINLYNTPYIVVAAFVIKHMSLAFQPLRTGFANISPSLAEAARLSGARPLDVWTRILLPILRPEVFGGAFLVLIPILGELTMSVFLASPTFRSIGTVLFDLQDYADQASAAALSILLVIVLLVLNELARLLSRGRLGY